MVESGKFIVFNPGGELVKDNRVGVEFFIAGLPIAKGRPRVAGKRAYTPKRTRQWEENVRAVALGISTAVKNAGYLPPTDGLVKVKLLFGLPIPKSWSKKRRAAAAGMFCKGRADLDNLAKAVLDGIQHVIIGDDRNVVELNVQKQRALETGVWVYVSPMDGEA